MSLERSPARQGRANIASGTSQYADDLITIDDACRVVGGSRPISRATYYRGVAAGRYPAPIHPSPGISRIIRPALQAAIETAVKASAD